MYSNHDIEDYSPTNPHVIAHTAHIEPYYLQQDSTFSWSYLAKKSNPPRILAMAGNRAITFERWGSISDSLKPYIQASSLFEKLPVSSKDEVFDEAVIQYDQYHKISGGRPLRGRLFSGKQP